MRIPENKTVRKLMGLGPALGIIGFFMVLPIGIIVVFSFMEANPYGGVKPHFSWNAYVQFLFERDLDDALIFNSAYLRIFARSFILALITTVLCLIIGFPTAYFMSRQPPKRKNLMVFLVTIPFWTNLLIRTYCLILLLRDTGVINNTLIKLGLLDQPLTLLYTNTAIFLGLVYTHIPFMVLPIYARVEKFDFSLFEAAHDLYANRRQLMRRVILPLSMPGVIAGCILVFVPCLGDFITPNLLGGGKHLMIGSLIQLQFGGSRNWPFGSAAALILLSVVLLSMMIYAWGPAKKMKMEGLE
ncbi:MAG: ABC transporter permease [Pseudomonadota bacterium]